MSESMKATGALLYRKGGKQVQLLHRRMSRRDFEQIYLS